MANPEPADEFFEVMARLLARRLLHDHCRGCGLRFLPEQPHHMLCSQCWHGMQARAHIAAARAHQLTMTNSDRA